MDTDTTLLSRFVRSRDEPAFRAIVERHGAMVHGVAWRRTQDFALAQEITQTVFTILARKAGALCHEELAGWLHRAAFMVTRNACRKESRRLAALREFTTHMMEETNPDPAWQELSPHLDEAMSCLSAGERQLVVMRYFEQRSYPEIASTTGKSEPTSRKQMQRALDRLGLHFRGRGIVTTGAALGVMLSTQVLCVPVSSAALTAAAALQAAPALTPVTLFTHTIRIMTVSTVLKTAVVTAALFIALAAIPVTTLWQQNRSLKHAVQELQTASLNARLSVSRPTAFRSPVPEQAVAATPNAKPTEGDPMTAMAGLLDFAENQIKQKVSGEVKLLTQRLNLSPAQADKLRIFTGDLLDSQLAALKENGLLAKSMKDPASLTAGELAQVHEMEDNEGNQQEKENFLRSLLTPEQQSEYQKSKDERRVAAAEKRAQETLTAVTDAIHLTNEKKDEIFQAIAQSQLAQPASGPRSGAGSSDDGILHEYLTPEQFQTYVQSQAEEARQAQTMLENIQSGKAPIIFQRTPRNRGQEPTP